jgi:hypothetical protein
MARRGWFATSLVALALLAGCTSLPFLGGEIRFSHEELSAKLAKRFPLEKSVAGLVEVKLANPRFETLDPGSSPRLAVRFDLEAKLPLTGKSTMGSLILSGRPRYDSQLRSIFIDDPKIEKLRLDNMSDAVAAALAKTATSVARDALSDKPVYAFTSEELTRYGMNLNPRRIEVRGDGIALVL